MSPAWWEGRPDLGGDTSGGRALRLLRRFLSAKQLEDFDRAGSFFVRGSGGLNQYRVSFGGLTERLVDSAPTHRLCVHTITDEPITVEEYYKAAGAEWRLLHLDPHELRRLMASTVQVPACDEMLANKLLLENDERKFVETAIITHLVSATVNHAWFLDTRAWTQGTAPYPI